MNNDWITILSKNETNDIYRVKEQINGLEALGDIVKENKSTTPMDSTDDSDEEVAVDTLTNSEDTPPSTEEGTDPANDDEIASNTNDEIGTTPDENQDDSTQNVGGDDPLANDGLDSEDTSGSTVDDTKIEDMVDDPHVNQNRRILLSKRLIQLYDDIKESMDILANGPAFENKPVTLDSLEKLSGIILSINETINKADYRSLLLKYAVCVKSYKKIIES